MLRVFVPPWFVTVKGSLIGSRRSAREFEHLVIRRVECVAAAAREHEMAPDDEQLAVIRRHIDAMARGRHRRKPVPVVDRRVEHLDVAHRAFDVVIANAPTREPALVN